MSLAANILADIVLLLQYGPLDQPKNQCREAGDCQHRAGNYAGTRAPVSARQSLRIRSYCLIAICKPPNDLRFHLVHRCNQMQPLVRAWQNTSAVSSSVIFGSPLSTPIHRKTEAGVASRIDCHSDVSFIFRDICRDPDDRDC